MSKESESILLYSANAKLVYFIVEKYGIGKHRFWCTTNFDSKVLAHDDIGANNPPSANPCDIYQMLKMAVERNDRDNLKITEIKIKLKQLAITWEEEGKINDEVKNAIIYTVDNAEIPLFEPYLYVTPTHIVKDRMKAVGPQITPHTLTQEYIVSDVAANEFHRLKI